MMASEAAAMTSHIWNEALGYVRDTREDSFAW